MEENFSKVIFHTISLKNSSSSVRESTIFNIQEKTNKEKLAIELLTFKPKRIA